MYGTNTDDRTFDRIEHAACGLPIRRRIPEAVERFYRENATCTLCGQRIAFDDIARRGVALYHSSCARRVGINEQTSSSRVEPEPRTIALISGRAIPLGERCTIFDKDGGERMELFDRSAFSEIDPDIPLRLNHNSASRIPCNLAVHVAPDGLDFLAMVPDTAAGRYLLMVSNEIRGVSIECLHQATAPDPGLPRGRGIIVKRAKLLGISICAGPRSRHPAWFGTHCRVVRVSQ